MLEIELAEAQSILHVFPCTLQAIKVGNTAVFLSSTKVLDLEDQFTSPYPWTTACSKIVEDSTNSLLCMTM